MTTLREEVEAAHRHTQAAQKIAYKDGQRASLGVRLALNKAQNILIKLLVYKSLS